MLARFFSLTFAVSWVCWVVAAAVQRATAAGSAMSVPATVLLYIGTFAPSLVALSMTARTGDAGGASALLGRVFRAEVGARWYVFAVGYLPVIKLVATLVHRFAVDTWPRFGETPWYVFVGAIALSTPVQAGEEIGWRGYALPRLVARLGSGWASVLLGVVWAVWHLPLFFIPGVDNHGQSFTLFVIGVTALSVSMTWLYVRTAGSLLLVMLMHSAVNQTPFIIPSDNPTTTNPFVLSASLMGWLTAAFLWIIAAYLLVRMRHIERSGAERQPAAALIALRRV